MSLQNFSNDELLLNEESSWLLDKEPLLLSDEQRPLLSDNEPLYLDDELSLDDELFVDSRPSSDKDKDPYNSTQNTISKALKSQKNKRKISKKQNNNTNKKTKPGKSWVWRYMLKDKVAKKIKCRAWIGDDNNLQQCPATFELTTSTTNLAGHLRTEHRLNQTGSLLLLNSKRETTRLQPVKLDLSQPTLLELVTRKVPLSKKKQERITSRILAWLIDDMQPFNVLANEQFQNILYEAEPQYQFPCEDIFKQKCLVQWSILKIV